MPKREKAYLQLYEDMQKKIVNGSYPFDTKIPSKRQYAQEMGVALVTVEHAYDLLLDEGYIRAKERSGYYVSYREGDMYPTMVHEELPQEMPKKDDETIPYSVFATTARRVLSEYGEGVLTQTSGKGDVRLRSAIASYLARARGMVVTKEQVVVGAGAEYLYGVVTSLLGQDRIYGIESPSYEKIASVYQSQNITIDYLKLARHGIHTEELNKTKATVLHVTPYQSFPSNRSTNAAKRREYIHWAQERNGYIIEDDYESEFIPTIKSAETLFSLDPQHVIYMNTFTKTIGSSVRVGYMILPESLSETYDRTQSFRSCTVSQYMQLIIAKMLNDGTFERHLNKVKRRRRQR